MSCNRSSLKHPLTLLHFDYSKNLGVSKRRWKVISWKHLGKLKPYQDTPKTNRLAAERKHKPTRFWISSSIQTRTFLDLVSSSRSFLGVWAWCFSPPEFVAERFKLHWDACTGYAGSTYDTSPCWDTQQLRCRMTSPERLRVVLVAKGLLGLLV